MFFHGAVYHYLNIIYLFSHGTDNNKKQKVLGFENEKILKQSGIDIKQNIESIQKYMHICLRINLFFYWTLNEIFDAWKKLDNKTMYFFFAPRTSDIRPFHVRRISSISWSAYMRGNRAVFWLRIFHSQYTQFI